MNWRKEWHQQVLWAPNSNFEHQRLEIKKWEADSFIEVCMDRCGVGAWNAHVPSSPHVVAVLRPSQWLNDGGDMPRSWLVAHLSAVQ